MERDFFYPQHISRGFLFGTDPGVGVSGGYRSADVCCPSVNSILLYFIITVSGFTHAAPPTRGWRGWSDGEVESPLPQPGV